jgi:hypothetical protein
LGQGEAKVEQIVAFAHTPEIILISFYCKRGFNLIGLCSGQKMFSGSERGAGKINQNMQIAWVWLTMFLV